MSLDGGGSEILEGFQPIAKNKHSNNVDNNNSQNDASYDEFKSSEFKDFSTSLHHHQMPNFAAILPDYSNREQEYIRQAFSVTSFVMVRDLPTRLRPSATNRAMAAKIDANRRSVVLVPEESSKNGGTKNGMFSTFDYVPSRYSLADELKTKQRLEDEAKRLEIGGRDFVCSGQSKKMKYEDVFENKEYRFPYMGDDFDGAKDQRLRAKWIEDAKVLSGPFMPSGRGRVFERPARSLLPECLKELTKIIRSDWEDYEFETLATEDDLICIRFSLDSVDSERGLKAYMNVLAASNPSIQKFQLQRVIEDWGTKPGDGWYYYMLKPPWCRTKQVDTFFALNPSGREVNS
jgi:hypothetical protein